MSITNMLVALLCSFAIVSVHGRSAKELKQVLIQEAMVCTKNYSVTPNELSQLRKLIIPETENAKCLIACLFKKEAWINDKGMVDIEAAHAKVESEYIDDANLLENSKKLFEECLSVNDEPVNDGEKGCDRSALFAKCLIKNLPKYNFKL